MTESNSECKMQNENLLDLYIKSLKLAQKIISPFEQISGQRNNSNFCDILCAAGDVFKSEITQCLEDILSDSNSSERKKLSSVTQKLPDILKMISENMQRNVDDVDTQSFKDMCARLSITLVRPVSITDLERRYMSSTLLSELTIDETSRYLSYTEVPDKVMKDWQQGILLLAKNAQEKN